MRVLQTHDGVRVVFKDHPPEVHHRAAERRLAHDELLAAAVPLLGREKKERQKEIKKEKKEANAGVIQYFASKVKRAVPQNAGVLTVT